MRGRRGGAGLGERHRLHRHEVLHQQVPLVVPAIRFVYSTAVIYKLTVYGFRKTNYIGEKNTHVPP